MFTSQQGIIAAHGVLRTGGSTFPAPVGTRRARPAQWVNWTIDGPVVVNTTYRVASEQLAELADIHDGERVLHVAAGAAEAGRRGTSVLPFRDAAFDVVLSSFGAIYSDSHFRMADELLRVCRRGGRIAISGWTPNGFDGELEALASRYRPQEFAALSPVAWGTRATLNTLFGHSADALGAVERTHTWRFASPEAWLDASKAPGGRLYETFRKIEPDWHGQLSAEILALVERFNEARDRTMLVGSDYLEFIVHKSTWRI